MRIELNDNNKNENAEKKDISEPVSISKKEYEDDSLEYSSLSLKEKIKYRNNQFKQRSSSMTTGQKFKYFIQFYKFVILAAVVVITIACIAGSIIYRASLPDALKIAIVNQQYPDDSVNKYIAESYRTYYGMDDKNYFSVYKELSVSANEDPEAVSLQMTSYQTLGFYNMHDMIDVIICDEEALKTYTWSDDTTAIDLAVDEELHKKLEPYIITLTDKTKVKNDGVSYEGALDISNTEFVKGARIEYSPVYLLIPSSKTVDNEATINFIKMVYGF